VQRSDREGRINDCWHISIRFGRNVLKNGMDPLAFLRYLLNLGEIAHITTLTDAMPEADEMDPESVLPRLRNRFRSHASKEAIERVFEFCRDDCELHILPPDSKLEEYLLLIDALPEETMRLGEILVKSGALTQEELDAGLRSQSGARVGAGDTAAAPQLGDILVQQQSVQPELVEAAAAKQKAVSEKKAAESSLIRVHADKLDQLIDLVGELVIAGASPTCWRRRAARPPGRGHLGALAAGREHPRLRPATAHGADRRNLQPLPSRRPRRVQGTDKEIELVISGAETELDKSVVEKIGDPLMHLVRNAMDHGIESARRARRRRQAGRAGSNSTPSTTRAAS
jgi:two-component system chemotaxis sensor kinase CheA